MTIGDSAENMNLPRFYTQEEYDQFQMEFEEFIFRHIELYEYYDYYNDWYIPWDRKYNYYLGARFDLNFVGTHKDGFYWLDNNNQIDTEYKLVNTFEYWNTDWFWIKVRNANT